ncbi:DNA binding domain protein, excisionase family [Kribbella flavida DSM 17836]|uniref:citrate synthase (unknown stereospecificity) n=1 Tax=Kribbella flavida (strain DSM 17836 / JCM 10339 / NBRC 14399) TaxID=479435 RepID=D2Q232_KRIFD|nr:citrate/2-methylcitrate synthase [Kribbella flavida]ADB33978.1 DNA binding domain protein, excisionase family [Kribbella flavida DSM 17836]
MPEPSDENYLTTAEVAARLKVKPETVYAYVSRGLLTSVRARGSRGSLFAATDVERLASRSVDHPGAIERIESALTLLTDDELYYRGHRAADLATSGTVESVAHLLWTGELLSSGAPNRPRGGLGPSAFPAPPQEVALARAAMAVAPPGARLTDQLRIAVAALGAGDPLRFDLTPQAVQSAAARILGVLTAALPDSTSPSGLSGASAPSGPPGLSDPAALSGSSGTDGSFGARLWPKLVLPGADRPPCPELLEAVIILLADHGLAVSTLAARVAASARANLYAVVSAGLGALDGQLHGAATTLAYEFLARAIDDPVAAVSNQLRSGQPAPGFGHKVYQRRDPRADVLLDLLGDAPITRTVRALADQLPHFPNSDLAVAALMHAYDFRPDAGEAIFALARTIGWTAHALEEYGQPTLRFRALGVYTGPAAITT